MAGLATIVNGTWGGTPAKDDFTGKTIALTNYINLSSYSNWVPIGDYADDTASIFQGTFNGRRHVISRLTIGRVDTDQSLLFQSLFGYFRVNTNYQGLFGYIRNGRVEDLDLDSVNIRGHNFLGSVVGYLGTGSSITNINSSGVISGIDNIGGVAGFVDPSSSVTDGNSTVRVVRRPPPVTSTRITNNTGYMVYYVYLSPAGSGNWGIDRLGSDVLQNGNTLTVNRVPPSPDNLYDILLVDSDGDPYTRRNVRLSQNQTLRFTFDDFDG